MKDNTGKMIIRNSPTSSHSDVGVQTTLNRLNYLMGSNPLSLEDKIRRAIRAAKLEETPKAVWLKVLPTIPEGVSTTRVNEMFCWARSLILDNELSSGLSHAEAHRNTVQRLLTKND